MTKRAWLLLVLAVSVGIVAVVALLVRRAPTAATTIDLVERFPSAEKRTATPGMHGAFDVEDVTIEGVTKRSILALSPSRIIWRVDVPSDALLETFLAMQPDSWTVDGGGATLRVGISDGQRFQDFARKRLDPYHRQEDRAWFPVRVDLAPYAGRPVDVIFNAEPNSSSARDAVVWGAPRIVILQTGQER
jgi:hypothetical protein